MAYDVAMSPRYLAASLLAHLIALGLLPVLEVRAAAPGQGPTALALGELLAIPAEPGPAAREAPPPSEPASAEGETPPEPEALQEMTIRPEEEATDVETVAPARAVRPPPPQPAPFDPDAWPVRELPFRLEHHRWVQGVLERVRVRIRYPDRAVENRWEGKVRVAFEVRKDGRIRSVRIAQASPYLTLDAAVEAAIQRASPFPPPPDGIPETFLRFERIYVFDLDGKE
ncbi:MAG: energy transducer TonB [Planctomycetes bacterium]|nr:energy transducer TonB [Planctomycetota bacterium]